MKKYFLLVPIFILVFSLLVACGGSNSSVPTIIPTDTSEPPSAIPTVELIAKPSAKAVAVPLTTPPNIELPTEPQKVYKWAPSHNTGSAKTLTGNCVVFMLFLSDTESMVNDETREDYLQYMWEADDFLSAQAADYGQTLKLVYGEDDLMLAYTSPTLLPSEMIWPFQMFWDATQGYDFETIAARYDADNIAYVLWLNKRGDFCYANPQREYLPDNANDFPEVCVMYTYSIGSDGERYPMASASVLVHEILHLFGAEDLYPGMNRTDEDNELLNSVYSSDIMRYGTGELSEKTLCEIDQYLVGWIPLLSDDLWRFIDYVEP